MEFLDEERERGGGGDGDREPECLELDAADEQLVVVDDGADGGGHRRPDERRDDHRPDHDRRRIEQEPRSRDDGADDRHHHERPLRGREVRRRRRQLLARDARAGVLRFLLGVLLLEFLEPLRDDRLCLQDDRVGVLAEALLAEVGQHRLDRVGRQREVDDVGVFVPARLLRDDVVDVLVIEETDDGLAFARRDDHLSESHSRRERVAPSYTWGLPSGAGRAGTYTGDRERTAVRTHTSW